MQRLTLIHVAFTLIALSIGETARAEFRNDIVAISGDTEPGGNGRFQAFFDPVLDGAGHVAFLGFVDATGNGNSSERVIFLGNGTNNLQQVARVGEPAPDGFGDFSILFIPHLNDAGQILYGGRLVGTGLSSDSFSNFRVGGATGTVRIVGSGDIGPGDTDAFIGFDEFYMNNLGQVLFRGLLPDPSGNNDFDRGIYLYDDVEGLTRLVHRGDPTPDGNGTFVDMFDLDLNDRGQFVGRGFFKNTNSRNTKTGFFLGDSTNGLAAIVSEGDAVPEGNGVFTALNTLFDLNNVGQVAFRGKLTNRSGGREDDQGIFLSDGTSNLVQIARTGDAAPNGGRFSSQFGSPILNDLGQIAFGSRLMGSSEDYGFFRTDGISDTIQIVREGDSAPGGGEFSSFQRFTLNNVGQAAFVASLNQTIGGFDPVKGLYLFDDRFGLRMVARSGDPLLGSTIFSLSMVDNFDVNVNGANGLNDQGQIAFRFQLFDGREGIAIASLVPEPDTLLLGLMASTLLLRRKGGLSGPSTTMHRSETRMALSFF